MRYRTYKAEGVPVFRTVVYRVCMWVIALVASFMFACGFVSQAHAQTVYVAEAPPAYDAPTEIGPIAFYFDHNVAASSVFSANQALFYVQASDGSSVPFSVYANYSDDAAGTVLDDRRTIYVQLGTLSNGVTYTVGVAAGVQSYGGHVYPACSTTFTTANLVEPEPSDGEGGGAGDGGGDSGSDDGHGASEDGAASGAGTADPSEEPDGQYGDETQPATSTLIDVPSGDTEVDSDPDAANLSGDGSSGFRRAYAIGPSGGESDFEPVVDPEPVAWAVLSLACIVAGLFVLGVAVRLRSWNRHRR